METFAHADDPSKVLQNYRRTLRSGGVLVMHEASWQDHCHGRKRVNSGSGNATA